MEESALTTERAAPPATAPNPRIPAAPVAGKVLSGPVDLQMRDESQGAPSQDADKDEAAVYRMVAGSASDDDEDKAAAHTDAEADYEEEDDAPNEKEKEVQVRILSTL
jgi:hypothetical protein